jgi:Arc/MetJ-type ribon-helix-helix transcriptional regulator
MKRISFVIPEELDYVLESERKRRDVSASAVIREALVAYLAGSEPRSQHSIIGLGRSGHNDTSHRIDEILDEEWGAARRP